MDSAATGDFRTPGQLIASLMESRGWSQRVLAVVMGISVSSLNKMISGRQRVDATTALVLSELFDVDAERFLELQQKYDLGQARLVMRPDKGRKTRAYLFGGLPIRDMIKRGWLDTPSVGDTAGVQAALTKFFGVDDVNDIEILPHAAKKTNVFGGVTSEQIAWLHRVRQIAKEILVPYYSSVALDRAIAQLRPLRCSVEAIRDIPKILAQAGIRFVVVESIPRAKIDGACFWFNERAPVVAMSLRYDRIDNFWFVLRHELEHVRLGHGLAGESTMLDADLEGKRAGDGPALPEEERLANIAAAEFCIPSKSMDSFVKRKAPFYRERDMVGFARAIKVHAGLVAGQLQRRTGRYDRFRKQQVKVGHIIRSTATADGWGDVYPIS